MLFRLNFSPSFVVVLKGVKEGDKYLTGTCMVYGVHKRW